MKTIQITESELREKIEQKVRQKLNELNDYDERTWEITAIGGLLRTTLWKAITEEHPTLGGKITESEFNSLMQSVHDGLARKGYIVQG